MPTEPLDQLFHEAMRAYADPLTNYAQGFLGDGERARDAVQDTFVKLWREPEAAQRAGVRPWLYAVCRNRCLDILRKEKRMVFVQQVPETVDESAPPDLHATTQERTTALLSLVESLPPHQREVVRLKFFHGLSYREISAATQLSESNVGFLLHTALKSLRQRAATGGTTFATGDCS